MVTEEDRKPGGAFGRLETLHTETVVDLRKQMDDGNYGAARAALQTAVAAFESIPDTPSPARRAGAGAADAGVTELAAVVDLPALPPAAPPTDQPPITAAVVLRNLRSLRNQLFWLDLIVLGVAIVVSLLIASLVLYSDTWGSADDIVTAVLWGLGIHIGTNYTFGGIFAMGQQLEGTTDSNKGDGG
jgi:hypothetical protein